MPRLEPQLKALVIQGAFTAFSFLLALIFWSKAILFMAIGQVLVEGFYFSLLILKQLWNFGKQFAHKTE